MPQVEDNPAMGRFGTTSANAGSGSQPSGA